MDCHIIGIDCATEPNKRGVALAWFNGNTCEIKSSEIGLKNAEIKEMLTNCEGRVLLAIDSPLGWPEPLGHCLAEHKAGKRLLQEDSHRLFRRTTDRFIKEKFNIQSLDVGADRIARTAHSALELLYALGEGSISLADDGDFRGISAVEVYPAATLSVYKLTSQGYKKPETVEVRKSILQGLEDWGISIRREDVRSKAVASADVLDAIVCVLAGMDFLKGNAHPPVDHKLAAKEGWIWVRNH